VSEDDELDPPFESVLIPAGEDLDLHSFAPRDVVSVVDEYLRLCRAEGRLEVRLVHGRGRGVQRAEVRRRLAELEFVESFHDAPPHAGGWGATFVRLRPE
jgi:DNA-nicking Smr family endonuclease